MVIINQNYNYFRIAFTMNKANFTITITAHFIVFIIIITDSIIVIDFNFKIFTIINYSHYKIN